LKTAEDYALAFNLDDVRHLEGVSNVEELLDVWGSPLLHLP